MHCSDVFKCKTFQICNALRGILEWALLNSQNMTQYPLNVKKFYRHVGWPSKYQKWTIIYMYIAWWKIFAPTIQKHALTHQIVQQILSTEVTFLYLEYKIINKENVWQLLEQRVLLSSRDVAILYVIMFFLSGGMGELWTLLSCHGARFSKSLTEPWARCAPPSAEGAAVRGSCWTGRPLSCGSGTP